MHFNIKMHKSEFLLWKIMFSYKINLKFFIWIFYMNFLHEFFSKFFRCFAKLNYSMLQNLIIWCYGVMVLWCREIQTHIQRIIHVESNYISSLLSFFCIQFCCLCFFILIILSFHQVYNHNHNHQLMKFALFYNEMLCNEHISNLQSLGVTPLLIQI